MSLTKQSFLPTPSLTFRFRDFPSPSCIGSTSLLLIVVLSILGAVACLPIAENLCEFRVVFTQIDSMFCQENQNVLLRNPNVTSVSASALVTTLCPDRFCRL